MQTVKSDRHGFKNKIFYLLFDLEELTLSVGKIDIIKIPTKMFALQRFSNIRDLACRNEMFSTTEANPTPTQYAPPLARPGLLNGHYEIVCLHVPSWPGLGTGYLSERCLCSRGGSGRVGRGMEVRILNTLFQFHPPRGANLHDGKDGWVGREGNSPSCQH